MANNQLLASDSFSSGSLAAGWSAVFGRSTSIVTGSPFVAEPSNIAVPGYQQWSGLTWPNDQSSEITINALSALAGTSISLLVRFQAGAESGYVALLTNGTATIYRDDAGTLTQLAQATGLTIAAGDVWVFQAAGVCLSLYQSNKFILRTYDATYSSGTPGFSQASTTAIADSKVGSWRGYNAVQQDGIWQKQGIVIAPNAADLALAPVGQGFQAANVIYDSNPQILPGPTVYKMWAVNNWVATTNVGGVYYFESMDGITWSRKAAAVLTGYTNVNVVKQGSTYYMYCQTNAGNGTGTIQVLTSSDGLSWVLQSPTSTISVGSAGAWDSSSIYEIVGINLIAGTWHGLYIGTTPTANGLFSTGHVTSLDGINWTKDAGNPVLIGALALAVIKIGNIFYGYFQQNQPGQGNAHDSLLNPIEIVRYQSTDYRTWTNPTHSLHHSRLDELVNTTPGYVLPVAILNVGGKAYFWFQSGADGGNAGFSPIGQITLAIGPALIESVVLSPENAVTIGATDNFTSGIGPLSANWTTPSWASAIQIVSGNKAEGTVLTLNAAVYTGVSFNPDQTSSVTLSTLSSSSQFVSPIVRANVAAETFYFFNLFGPIGTSNTSFQIQKIISGVVTTLGPLVQVTPQVGDVFRIQVIGNVISAFQNEFLILQVEDFANLITSGSPGFFLNTATALANNQINAFSAGNANSIPNYPSVSSSSWLSIALANSLRGLRH